MTDLSRALLKTKDGKKSEAKGRVRRIVVLAKEEVSEVRKRERE